MIVNAMILLFPYGKKLPRIVYLNLKKVTPVDGDMMRRNADQ